MKKSILLICPYDNIYPPMNGGMQRCFHVIHQLSKYIELTVIMNQEKDKFLSCVSLYPSINNINIYSTNDFIRERDVFDYLPKKLQLAIRYRWIKKKIKGSADGEFFKYYSILERLIKNNKYDSIILENLSTINAIGFIRRFDKNVKIIYDAHNVDSNLALEEFNKGRISKKNFMAIKKQESFLYKNVNSLFVCSNTDKIIFNLLNENKLVIKVVPNGVVIHPILTEKNNKPEKAKYILFCGSLNYEPNTEGLIWFYKNCWPTIRYSSATLKLLVVGSGSIPLELMELKNDNSIIFTGTVHSVSPYYNKATLAIAPLLSGSGTRLKILEAMSFGLPVISTSKGAEGINYTNEKDIIIADSIMNFTKNIIDILDSDEKQNYVKNNARKLIEEYYDWDIIGRGLIDDLTEMQ